MNLKCRNAVEELEWSEVTYTDKDEFIKDFRKSKDKIEFIEQIGTIPMEDY